jgi:hypothetical protein
VKKKGAFRYAEMRRPLPRAFAPAFGATALALFRQPQAGRSGDARRLTRRVGAEIAQVRAEMVTARLVGALGHV